MGYDEQLNQWEIVHGSHGFYGRNNVNGRITELADTYDYAFTLVDLECGTPADYQVATGENK